MDSCISEHNIAEINETSLHYIECGEGDLLVFVHGAFGDLVSSFGEQIETFARDFLHSH